MDLSQAKARITALMLFCLAFAAAVLSRAALVQIVAHPRLEQMARRQFQSKVLIRPRRGEILDRSGEPLAVNVEASSLAANPTKITNTVAMAKRISRATDLPYKKTLQRLQESKEFVWLKRHLSDAELRRLHKWRLIDDDGGLVGGLMMVKETKRVYPHGELASHWLGGVNVDSEGVDGVELWQDEKMRGKILSVNAIKDARGRPTFIDSVSAKTMQEHRDGEAVSLTIDASLQFAVERELRGSVAKTGARGGTVIVMNAVDGEILAMANSPTYNPNESSAPADHRRNRALTDGYEPGSTLKAALIAAALSHGWKLTDQVWGERGKGFSVQGRRIHESESREVYDWLSLNKLIKVSSNVGAAKVALKLGADSYYSMLKALGFGAKTGTGFPGEISGMVPPRKAWQPITLANIGFGQGVLVTPMQMTRLYATFLNGGWLVRPKLIHEVSGQSPGQGPDLEAAHRVLSEKVAGEMLETLQGPLQAGGTGVKANLNGYRIAGKTGTAQKVDPATHSYSRSRYVASFIGMALGVEPKIVIFAALDEPRGVYYASDTAAPLFREVLNSVAARFSLPTQPDTANPVLKPRADALRLSAAHPLSPPNPWAMPSLKGLTPREAMQALQGRHIRVEMRGVGLVRAQVPAEGAALPDGEVVRVLLGEGS